MKLYYTVASQPEDIQTKPNLSLGGFKSSSLVLNSVLGNLFGDISMYTAKNNTANNYIGLVLVNDTGKVVTNIEMWFVRNTGCISTFKVAAVTMVKDADDNLAMEHIPTYNSKPLYATFVAAEGTSGKVNIGGLAKDAMMGLWIERTLDLATLRTQQNAIYSVDPTDPYRYVAVVLDKEDLISIGFSWTET